MNLWILRFDLLFGYARAVDEDSQIEAALGALEGRLERAQAERKRLEVELRRVDSEVRLAKLALESISILTGRQPGPVASPPGITPPAHSLDPLPSLGRTRGDSSTEKVIGLLRSSRREWTRDEILVSATQHGWTEEWAKPADALRMALNRAVRLGAAIRVRQGVYRAADVKQSQGDAGSAT